MRIASDSVEYATCPSSGRFTTWSINLPGSEATQELQDVVPYLVVFEAGRMVGYHTIPFPIGREIFCGDSLKSVDTKP
eukprot:scaffold34620_cov160-Amphora_coffeaeformis.AAC.2